LPPFLAVWYPGAVALPAGAQAFVFRSTGPAGDVVLRVARPGVILALDDSALAAISSPHLARIIEAGSEDGIDYQVFEFVPGHTLEDLLASNLRPDDAFIRPFVEQMERALSVLADAQLVHGDLKPANIVVTHLANGDLHFVVIDFGLTRRARHTIVEGLGGGTPEYLPPEGFCGYLTRCTDWWSLGMIVAEMLLGRHPLGGSPSTAIALAVITRRFDISGVPDSWSTLVRGLLTADYECRWTGHAVREWLDGRTPPLRDTADVPGPPVVARRPFVFDGVEHHQDPRLLADRMGSNWAEAARTIGSPSARTALSEWARQFNDAHLLATIDHLGDPDATLDHEIVQLIGALYAVHPGEYVGAGPTWYRGERLTPPRLHHLCERALEQSENLIGWSGSIEDIVDHDALVRVVRLMRDDLALLAGAAGPSHSLTQVHSRFDAGGAFLSAHAADLEPPAEPWELTLWSIRLLHALTGPGASVRLRETADRAVRRRADLRHLASPTSGPAHHLLAEIRSRRTVRWPRVRSVRDQVRRRLAERWRAHVLHRTSLRNP